MKESTLKKKIIDRLKEHGFRAKKFIAIGNAGEPDIETFRMPLLWGIELKQAETGAEMVTNTKKWTAIQRVRAVEILKAGGGYALVGSTKKNRIVCYFWNRWDFPMDKDIKDMSGCNKIHYHEFENVDEFTDYFAVVKNHFEGGIQ